jgi:ABC-type thiamine transport system substrate-binding protein
VAGWESNDLGTKRNDPTTGRNDILEAINQLVKFQDFDVRESINAPGRIKDATSPYFPIELSFLAIVFDGKLFEAIPNGDKLSLEETNHLLLHFIYRPRNSFNN